MINLFLDHFCGRYGKRHTLVYNELKDYQTAIIIGLAFCNLSAIDNRQKMLDKISAWVETIEDPHWKKHYLCWIKDIQSTISDFKYHKMFGTEQVSIRVLPPEDNSMPKTPAFDFEA